MGDSRPPADAAELEDDRLDALVAEALARLETGGAAALDQFLAGQGDDAAAVRARVESLRTRGLLDAAVVPAGAVPERLGDFRLIRELGSGGMGVVYLAEQIPLKRRVALKLLQPSHLYFPHARARFQREIETVARLNHPGIVPIYLVGEDQGLPWFAMEHVDGCSLADLVREFSGADPRRLTGADLRAAIGRIAARAGDPHEAAPGDEVAAQRVFSGSWTDACLRLFVQVAEALAHAHSRGVLHRDVKPSNIMVSLDGRARLVDFGLALLEGSSSLTRTGMNPGSLPYMSPEQISARPESLDARTDVYSLGVTLYELLTLRPAFEGASSELTRRRILAGDTPRPRKWHRGLHRDVETVCLKAMATEPARRYAAAGELARDLELAREGRPIAARPPGVAYSAWRFLRIHPLETLAAAALAAIVLAAIFGEEFGVERTRERDLAQVDPVAALRSVLRDCFENRSPKPEDLAAVTAWCADSGQRDAFELLRVPPADAQRWEELRKLLPGTAADPAPEQTPLAPLAAITDRSPLFRFDVPPPDGAPHRYEITISAAGRPDRTLQVERAADQRGPLEAVLDGEPLDVGVDYAWCVRRVDGDGAAAADGAPAPARAAFKVLDAAQVERQLAAIATGAEALDQLMRAAMLLRLELAHRALQQLASFPPDASAEDQAFRLLLEGRAHVMLADAEGFAIKHAEAQRRASTQ